MKPFAVSMVLALIAAVPVATQAQAYPGSDYAWGPGYEVMISRAADILQQIDSPARKSALAEQWLDFSKRMISKSIEQRGEWLGLQEQHLAAQRQASQADVDLAAMQVQVEQLRAQNLKLENENLQLRQQLQGPAAPAQPQAQAQAQPPASGTPTVTTPGT